MSEKTRDLSSASSPNRESNWFRVVFYIYVHILMIYGILLACTEALWSTILFSTFLIILGVIGVGAGAHRLWAHASYTATVELRIFLMLCQTLVGQGTIYEWVMYHRIHHKYFKTNLDPFNPGKGFFYSHIFCLTKEPLPEQKKLEGEIDMSDLEADSVVMFQKKHYWTLLFVMAIFIPLYLPYNYWDESFLCSCLVTVCMRYGVTLHFAWLVHSAITILSLRQGEKFPSDTNWVFLFYKTHWLKFHHVAPWDYQTGEYGKYGNDWISTFIRVCAVLEVATNLKTVDSEGLKNAVYTSMKTKKPLSQCLLDIDTNTNIPKDHYLQPKKYY